MVEPLPEKRLTVFGKMCNTAFSIRLGLVPGLVTGITRATRRSGPWKAVGLRTRYLCLRNCLIAMPGAVGMTLLW
jgi:hypothetical protein